VLLPGTLPLGTTEGRLFWFTGAYGAVFWRTIGAGSTVSVPVIVDGLVWTEVDVRPGGVLRVFWFRPIVTTRELGCVGSLIEEPVEVVFRDTIGAGWLGVNPVFDEGGTSVRG